MALRRSHRLSVEVISKTAQLTNNSRDEVVQHTTHNFTLTETKVFQDSLLQWYDTNKRDLPWRTIADSENASVRAYAVLVSEIMLQQTQVVTVRQYFAKWMDRWPTFEDLATATLEEVNEMWSGLGYYSRGRRLYETAKKIVADLSGQIPNSAAMLEKELPGVGRYTAGAVASIAFGQQVAAVDGNVIRVLSRMRLIGADSASQSVIKQIWKIAESNVDANRPGDFNQAMMELGALICTPRAPSCSSCPVSKLCTAYKQSQSDVCDIEVLPECSLCLPSAESWVPAAGVTNLPRKAKKAAPRKEEMAVALMYRRREQANEYLLMKRLSQGLLANMWEFPSFLLVTETKDVWVILKNKLKKHLEIANIEIKSQEHIGTVQHIFSHIHQTNIVYRVEINEHTSPTTPEHYQEQRWVSEEEFLVAAVSTGMRKIFKTFHSKIPVKNFAGKRSRSTLQQ